jgi:hypothetical protein
VLALKLFLVPFFLGVISLAGKYLGPNFAGWLAGLPVVVGPILFLVAMDQGAQFAGASAIFTLATVGALMAFAVGYAWCATRMSWPLAALGGLAAWFAMAALIFAVTWTLPAAIAFAAMVLFVAPRIFPKSNAVLKPAPLPHGELFLRMAVGGLLTFCVAAYAASLGERLSGIAALAPVLTPVLAVFIHRRSGADHAIALLRGLSRGLITLAVFVATVAWCLPQWGITISFGTAVAVALVLHGFALWWVRKTK